MLNERDSALLQLAQALRDLNYHFTTPTPATHERVNDRPQNAHASDLPGVFGWSRPFHVEVLPSHIWELMQRADAATPPDSDGLWRSRVRLSSLHGQLFWHSAFPTVEADAVFFGPDTYRYANALQHAFALGLPDVKRVVDIGCGGGAGAILTALARPNAQVFAVDINDEALRLTRINAALAGVEVETCNSNLLTGVNGSFDLIVANPPYLVDPSERAYRHGGGPLGAGLSLAIVESALARLAPGGTLLLYTGVAMIGNRDPFREAIEEILAPTKAAWLYRELDPDVFGEELETGVYTVADRIAAVELKVSRQ